MYAQRRATMIIPGTVKDKRVFGTKDTAAKTQPRATAAPRSGRTKVTFGGTMLVAVGMVV